MRFFRSGPNTGGESEQATTTDDESSEYKFDHSVGVCDCNTKHTRTHISLRHAGRQGRVETNDRRLLNVRGLSVTEPGHSDTPVTNVIHTSIPIPILIPVHKG